MLFPSLKAAKERTGTFSAFTSLVTQGTRPDGGFSMMKNLSSDLYPNLSIRKKRGVYTPALGFGGEKITELCHVHGGLLECTESSVYLDGVRLGVSLDPTVENRTAVPFGRNVFIVPDGIYIQKTDEGIEVSDCSFSAGAHDCSIGYAMADGTEIFPSFLGEFPPTAGAGDFAVIGDGSSMECWQYTGQFWKKMYDVYIKIFIKNGISGISAGDTIRISGTQGLFEDGWHNVISATPASLIVSGNLTSAGTCSHLEFSASVPLMDFAVEHNNRIYGCRYGKNNDGKFVNEIYISKQGDPRQWYSFQGISTDSYTVSLGCSGEFTGAAVLGSEVLFFKEDCVVRVLGSTVSEFSVYVKPLAGVEKGSHRSLCTLSDALFYKSREGICVYDGNFSASISDGLSLSGFSCGVAGEHDGKYRISLRDVSGGYSLFIYDTKTRLWHCEDDDSPTRFIFRRHGNLFHVTENGGGYTVYTPDITCLREENRALPLMGETAFCVSEEEQVFFSWETGRLFENVTSYTKKIRCIRFNLSVGDGAELRLFMRCDGSETKIPISFIDRKTDGIFTASVPVPYCNFFTLCGEGRGEITMGTPECVISSAGEVRELE